MKKLSYVLCLLTVIGSSQYSTIEAWSWLGFGSAESTFKTDKGYDEYNRLANALKRQGLERVRMYTAPHVIGKILDALKLDWNFAHACLFFAARDGNQELIELVFELHPTIDINAREKISTGDVVGWTALAHAIVHGKGDVACSLVEKEQNNIKPNLKYHNGNTLLTYALYPSCFKENGEYKRTFAKKTFSLPLLEALLSIPDIDVNLTYREDCDFGGFVPLAIAAITGNVEAVKLLVEHKGVDTKVIMRNGEFTLLEIAAQAPEECREEIITILKDHGAI